MMINFIQLIINCSSTSIVTGGLHHMELGLTNLDKNSGLIILFKMLIALQALN